MTDQVMNTKSLPEILFRLIPTEKVRLREADGIIQLIPVKETTDCTKGLRGMFAGYPDMSVDNFLKRKHADKLRNTGYDDFEYNFQGHLHFNKKTNGEKTL